MSAPHELPIWSYVAPDGKEVVGDEQELLDKLRKGVLPPTTLVWQKTWLEWLPAARVSELAAAFPKPRAPLAPLEPKRSPTALSPPARPQGPKLPRAPIAFSPNISASVDKGADPSSFGTFGRARGASVLGPARAESANTAPPRPPLATLGDEPNEQRSTTLRPPGAIPPPPRAVPGPSFDLTPSRIREELEAPTRRQNPPSFAKDTVTDPNKPGLAGAVPSETGKAVVTGDLDATLGSTPFEVTAQDFVDLSPPSTTVESAMAAPADMKTAPSARKRRSTPPAKKSGILGIVALATGVGLATFFIVKLLIRPKSEVASTPLLPAPPPEAPQATTAAPSGCGIVQPAARLSPRVHRPVTPLVTAAADATRASIGFAETETEAAGVTVDLVTLDVARVFRQEGKTPVRFVVPRALDAQRFIVDRDDGRNPVTRSFDVAPGFGIGTSDKDWVRVAGGSSGVLWRDQATDKTTDPRVASSAEGHVVTFRRGGLSGQVMVGLLAPDGSAKGDLRTIEAPGVRLSGTPDAAVSGKTWLVAFAGRATPEEPWRIVLARGTIGGAAAVRPFATPPGGAGGSSIAPSVSGLGDGGFVLQWTEGKTAEYQVRVQRLGPDLEPLGEAALVSPKGANAGQGVVFARAPRALSLFVQTTQGHDELWGTSLECP